MLIFEAIINSFTKKLELCKVSEKKSEIEFLSKTPEQLISNLATVMLKFQLKKHFTIFDFIKSKGLAVSSLLNILIILPFYGFASIHSLVKTGLHQFDFEGEKDVLYDAKNSTLINWRKLLSLHAKRFIYLINNNINLKTDGVTAFIADDTILEKTGKKIEKVSMVHNHTSIGNTYVLGFKLLVLGFWDGESFIPIDFSLHREKGNQKEGEKLNGAIKSAQKNIDKQNKRIEKATDKLHKKSELLEKKTTNLKNNRTKTNEKAFDKSKEQYELAKSQLTEAEDIQVNNHRELEELEKKLRRFYQTRKLYGLSKNEREAQYKKEVESGTPSEARRKEADENKIRVLLKMISRAVKNGIVADYFLVDSWFFCLALLEKLSHLKKGAIKLISMVKINNQIFTLCQTDKQMSVKQILKTKKRKSKRCTKFKSDYIKVHCTYKGIRVNLFYMRMGKSNNWKLLVTTDLSLTFIKIMELYQIRWSIEVFFKESKQYLNLGKCQSNCFDAQIADITLSMMQFTMLTYFKRIHYQQSIGGLFKEISDELVMQNLIKRLMEIFWELVEILCDMAGIDFLELQKDAINNDQFITKFISLQPQKNLNKAA